MFVVPRPSPEDQQGHDESAPLSGDPVGQTGAFDEGVECIGRRQVALQMALAERVIVPGRIREPLVTPIDQRLLSPRATGDFRILLLQPARDRPVERCAARRRFGEDQEGDLRPGPGQHSAAIPTTCYVTALSTTILAQHYHRPARASGAPPRQANRQARLLPYDRPCTETGAVSILDSL